MKIKLLAVSIAALACGTQAYAAQIYSSDGSTLSIGGYVDVGLGEYGSSKEVEVHQVSPRLNVEGTQELGNGVTVDAKGEWALNYLGGGDTSFTTRLGYIGATHEQAGRLALGTQWAPYYDVAGVADKPIAFANNFVYENHGNLATGRGDKMVTYRNMIDINDDVMLGFGLGWQGKHTGAKDSKLYDARGQVAVSLSMMGMMLGYAYNSGDIDNVEARSHLLSLKYGNYGDGVYGALVYADNKNFYDSYYESNQYEAVLAYGLGNGLNLIVNYEAVEGKKMSTSSKKTVFSESALQAEYNFTPKLVGFAGYQFDLGDDDPSTKDHDQWTFGARYFF
ncbi:porin [Vibrio sinaloensis]|uniref:porin n=1 Tax=Photobacterium sp. (strain ATCC 43367) TaxID=379097 RepID=UPI0020477274|nr:porin [Vibrio sinaloensis]UPQ89539.1 porin [Vibrio sinaloensis]